jgi:hypothetical protein
MELERLKAALQERKFEGYLFERPVRQIALDIQRKAKSIEEKQRIKDVQAMIGVLILVPIYFFWFDSRQPWWSQVGIGLMIAGIALEALCFLRLYLQGRRIRFDLPRENFLVEERRRLRIRIRILKREAMWCCAPMIIGVLLYFAWQIKSAIEFVICFCLLVVACGAAWWNSARKHGRELESLLNEIDQELAQIGSSRPV